MIARAALPLLAFLASSATAQITLTIYYVVPPTNGCNGLAAMGPASDMWSGGCTAPYIYDVQPGGCAEAPSGWPPFWISGDTVYTNLCSTPCSISIWDAGGTECVILCQFPVILGMPEGSGSPGTLLMPNPHPVGMPLEVSALDRIPTDLLLMDAQGRVIERIAMGSAAHATGRSSLSPGPYLLQARWPDGRSTTQRLVVH